MCFAHDIRCGVQGFISYRGITALSHLATDKYIASVFDRYIAQFPYLLTFPQVVQIVDRIPVKNSA